MNIIILSDTFLPERISGASHMSDLVSNLTENGHECCIVTTQKKPKFDKIYPNLQCIYVNNPFRRTKILALRGFLEIVYPIILALMFFFLRHKKKYDLVISYSPSIFWCIFLNLISKNIWKVNLLIVRDLFPLWLTSVGVLKKQSIIYKILNFFAKNQYNLAYHIFAQSNIDKTILSEEYSLSSSKIILLDNWYKNTKKIVIPDNLTKSINPKQKIFLMLGNFGIAQNYKFLADVFDICMSLDKSIKLVLIGLKQKDKEYFTNILSKYQKNKRLQVFNSFEHNIVVNYARLCSFGIVSLHPQNTPGNIPGKFCAYSLSGLPTICFAPDYFEISKRIKRHKLGFVVSSQDKNNCAHEVLSSINTHFNKNNITRYGKTTFDVDNARKKILSSLEQ